MIRSIVVLSAMVLGTVTVCADEVEDFVENVDAAYYAPDLDDLHCHVVWESLRDGTFKGVVVHLYWKAPDLRRCKIENPPADLGDPAETEKNELRMLENIVREPFAVKAERFTFTLREEGDLTALEGIPKEGSREAQEMVTKQTWWFDGELKLVKSIREDFMGKTRWEYAWKETDVGYLLDQRKEINMATPEFLFKTETFSFEENDDGQLLLNKVAEERMVGGSPILIETLLQNYEVNTGLDDDLFEEGGK